MPSHTLDELSVLYIFGRLSTALEIADAARACNEALKIIFVSGNQEQLEREDEIREASLPDRIKMDHGKSGFIISVTNDVIRRKCLMMAVTSGLEAVSVIHPQAWVSPSASIGEGCYLAAGSRVSSNARLERHCMLNFNVVFGHDSVARSHFVSNPGAVISGNVSIGERVLVGANTFILQGTTIGDDCQVDALTYAGRDIERNSLCTSRQFKVFPRRS